MARHTSSRSESHEPLKQPVVVGPVLPFRGGIAQHTTMLARAIRSESGGSIVSFKRLFPRSLYPGASDRDPQLSTHQEAGTEYFIDSINPVSWRRGVEAIARKKPAFVIFPWWTFFLGPCFSYMASALRRRNIDVVFLCHNVSDHEDRAWKRFIARTVLRQGSRFVVHTNADRQRLQALLPGAEIALHPHPIYEHFPPPARTPPRRAERELLFYGFVRPYKGLDVLVEALGLLRDESVFLTIAGEFWEGHTELSRRAEALGITRQLEIRPRYHSDAESAELFARADVVVLPYLSATGSGVIPLAYRYGCPVIASRVGGIPDVVADGSTGWLVESGNAVALAETIRRVPVPVPGEMRRAIARFCKTLTWQSLAHIIIDPPCDARHED